MWSMSKAGGSEVDGTVDHTMALDVIRFSEVDERCQLLEFLHTSVRTNCWSRCRSARHNRLGCPPFVVPTKTMRNRQILISTKYCLALSSIRLNRVSTRSNQLPSARIDQLIVPIGFSANHPGAGARTASITGRRS